VTLARRVAAAWYAPRLTLFAALLWPLSLLYRGVVAVRRTLFRLGLLSSHRLRVPVIVVGNVTVGGAGKTPLVAALAEWLAGRGYRPGIVSRGYGGSAREAQAVTPGEDPRVVGDEPLLFATQGFPVWIGRERVAAARGLLAAHPECNVLLADDGLQHYALARTMEIVALDATRGVGNGLMLPAGPLREPVSRLRSVDAVVRLVPRLAPTDGVLAPATGGRDTLMTHEPLPWRNLVDASREADLRAWHGRDVHAVCGTGNPQRFFDMVRSLGIVATNHAFPDHHPFAPSDLAFPRAAAILMTQKDAVKCMEFADDRCWYLPLRVVVDPALLALVEDKIRGFETA
jgi:tetraacyldisaccharide 4'-kinase